MKCITCILHYLSLYCACIHAWKELVCMCGDMHVRGCWCRCCCLFPWQPVGVQLPYANSAASFERAAVVNCVCQWKFTGRPIYSCGCKSAVSRVQPVLRGVTCTHICCHSGVTDRHLLFKSQGREPFVVLGMLQTDRPCMLSAKSVPHGCSSIDNRVSVITTYLAVHCTRSVG